MSDRFWDTVYLIVDIVFFGLLALLFIACAAIILGVGPGAAKLLALDILAMAFMLVIWAFVKHLTGRGQ